jgi:small subunit ribosomal protein S6
MVKPRIYEILYIMDPTLPESANDEIHQQLIQLINESEGKVRREDKWGKRHLAYEVQKHREGFYAFIEFDAVGATLDNLKEHLRTETRIIRHLITQVPKAKMMEEERQKKKAADEAEKAKKRAEEEARRAVEREEQKAREEAAAAAAAEARKAAEEEKMVGTLGAEAEVTEFSKSEKLEKPNTEESAEQAAEESPEQPSEEKEDEKEDEKE